MRGVQGVARGICFAVGFGVLVSLVACGEGADSDLFQGIEGGGGTPNIEVTPSRTIFLEGASEPILVTVANTGTGSLLISSVTLEGGDADAFGLTRDTCSGTSLDASATCEVDVVFTPTSDGQKSVNLRIASNDPDQPLASVELAGGPTPSLAPGEPAVDAGSVPVGQVGESTAVTFVNRGNVALSIQSVSLASDDPQHPDQDQFQIVQDTTTCTAEDLQPDTQCTVDVVFAPTSAGLKSARLDVVSEAPTASVVLQGTGEVPAAVFSPVGFTLAFPDYPAGTGIASEPLSITVTNQSAAGITVTTPTFSGAAPSEFVLYDDGCGGSSLLPNADCTIQVAFSPTSPGLKEAILTVETSGGSATFSVSGTGLGPAIVVEPAGEGYVFQDPVSIVSSATRTVTISNGGNSKLIFFGITLDSEDFYLGSQSDSCLLGVEPGTEAAPCLVEVIFAPQSEDLKEATLTLESNDPVVPEYSFKLAGTGLNPIAVSPAPPVAFTTPVAVGSSELQSIRILNASGQRVDIGVLGTEGTDATAFSATGCTGTLDVGAECPVEVTFAPTTAGDKQATLVIPVGPAGATMSVPLTGTAVAAP